MADRPKQPLPGRHYAATEELDPQALPERRATPIDAAVASDRPARPRRSRGRATPKGGYFYWCLACDTCLTDRRAFCPEHKPEYDRLVKARARELARPDMTVEKATIRHLRDLAARVSVAREDLIDAINNQSPHRATSEANYLTVSRRLITAVRRLPDPPHRAEP